MNVDICNKTKNIAVWTAVFLPGVLSYVFWLINRISELRIFSIMTRFEFIKLVPVMLVLFYIAFCLPGKWRYAAVFMLLFSFCGMALAGFWATGTGDYYAVGGLVPWTYARNYYADALGIFEGLPFSGESSWRPLFPAMFASLLAITGQNLQLALSLLVALVAIAFYFFALEINHSRGPLMAAFVVVVLFVYYRRFIGVVSPENLGVALGLLGFVLLWRGSRDHNRKEFWGGVFLTSLALFCRLGAFLVLPLLVVWSGWLFRNRQRFSWQTAGWSAVFSSVAFIVYFLSALLYTGGTTLSEKNPKLPFTYYAPILFQLVNGYDTNWDIFAEYPQLVEMTDRQRAKEIYPLAMQEFCEHPSGALKGAALQWSAFFTKDWYSVYSFIEAENQSLDTNLDFLFSLFCLVGVIGALFRCKNDRYSQLILVLTAGFFLSVPFVTATLFNRMRLYAATIALVGILPAEGLSSMALFFDRLILQKKGSQWLVAVCPPVKAAEKSRFIHVYAIFLVGLMVLGPLLIWLFKQPTHLPEMTCADGQQAVFVKFKPGSFIQVVEDESPLQNWTPNFREGRFFRLLHDNSPHYQSMLEFESRVKPPVVILTGLDLNSGLALSLVADSTLMTEPPALLGICGQWSDNPAVQKDRFFYAESVEALVTR